MKEAGLIW